MPYDLYDYFTKQRNHPLFTETLEKIRQNVWRESVNVTKSQEWLKTEDRIFIDLYHYLRYN